MAEQLIRRGKVSYYRLTDADGRRVMRKGCFDKRVTEELARDAQSKVARTKAGLSDPKAERIAREARRPYRPTLTSSSPAWKPPAATPNTSHRLVSMSLGFVSSARVSQLSDLTPSSVVTALAMLREQGFATRTLGAYATGIKSLSKWAWKDGRTTDYALNALTKPSDPNDRRRIRRPLGDIELRSLIESTRQAPPFRKASGPDLTALYLIASLTGFRRDELLSLTPASFRLDGPHPVVVCEGGYTKNKARAEQPLPLGSVAIVKAWLQGKAPGTPVFASIPRLRTGVMLRQDLARCGIPFKTPEGVVDLHSLRHGYITALGKAGVPVKVLQTLARHADPRLTLNVYSHISLFDTASAVESLPDLSRPVPPRQTMAATGTDHATHKQSLAPYLPILGTLLARVCRFLT